MSILIPRTCDWQSTKKHVKDRAKYLLDTGMWSDCRFIVGIEPNQHVLEAHKLFLAMASPVFEAMFFGGMAEKDPIAILDVQPEAFKALLEYVYTDTINFTSFDQACELCYAAKKYMLPLLVEECTRHLWGDLKPKNACRAYEFAKLFEEPVLMEKSFEIICSQTEEVFSESSFEEAELSTILTIFDQDYLKITTELALFNALSRYANRQNECTGVKVPRLEGIASPSTTEAATSGRPTIKDALMKIRFLTLTPQQFAEGPASSNLLTQSEKFAILMKISYPSTDMQMPTGFCTSTVPRIKFYVPPPNPEPEPTDLIDLNKMYCTRQLLRVTDCLNSSVLDCALTFSCDKNICVLGVQVAAQIQVDVDVDDRQQQSFSNNTYTELLYAHLLDADGSRLTYTHFTSRVMYRSLIDITFNRPIYIQRNKSYKVGVVLNKTGWYPIGVYPACSVCNGVTFMVGQANGGDNSRDGLIRSIIFTAPSANQSSVSNIALPNRGGLLQQSM